MIVPKILLWCFVLFNVTDIYTTTRAGLKHGFDYEANIIYAFTNSILLVFLFKILFTILLIWILTKQYRLIKFAAVRFFIVYVTVIVTFALLFVSVNNYNIYKMDLGDIGPPPTKEDKIEFTKQMVKSGTSMSPQFATLGNTPQWGTIILNLIQFAVWREWEKWKIWR